MILSALLIIVDFIIGLLPFSLPSGGESFQTTLGVLQGYLDNVISFIYSYVLNYEIVVSIFTLLTILILAKVAYWNFMWIIRKLPIGVEA